MRKLAILVILLVSSISLCGQNKTMYSQLREQWEEASSEELYKHINRIQEWQANDTTIVLYSILYNRNKENADEQSKQYAVLSCIRIGKIYYYQGNYTNALDFFIRGLKICECCKDQSLIREFYLNMGNIYCTFQDYEKGISCYESGYKWCAEYPDNRCEYSLLTNLVGAYSKLGNAEKTREYYFQMQKKISADDPVRTYMNQLTWGLVLINEKKYRDAIAPFQRAADIARNFHLEPRYESASYSQLYHAYLNMNQKDSTLYYLNKCQKMAKEHNLVGTQVENYRVYSILHEMSGDSQQALLYKSKFLSLSDSIFNVREFHRVKNTQYLLEIGQVEKEISQLNREKAKKETEIRHQQKMLLFVMGLSVIAGIFLIIAYLQKKHLSVAYQKIFNVNRELVDMGKYNKNLRMEFEEKLNAVEQVLESYHQKEAQPFPSKDAPSSTTEILTSKSYSSKLDDTRKQALIEAINQIMETTHEYCKTDFSLEKLASLVHSNHRYVSQVINETYKKNFSSFLNEYRIREARKLMSDINTCSKYTIKTIAEKVGYRSHVTFGIAFKSIVGLTPAMFLQMIKEEHNHTKVNTDLSDTG